MSDSVSGDLDSNAEVLPVGGDVKAKPSFAKVFSEKANGKQSVSNNTNKVVSAVSVEKVNPQSVFEKAFGGGKVTIDQNVANLNVADEHLGMKTEVNDPMVMTVFEVLAKRAHSKGYFRTAEVYGDLINGAKVNMVSFRRGGRKEQVQILTAQREAEINNPSLNDEGAGKLGDKRGGRR